MEKVHDELNHTWQDSIAPCEDVVWHRSWANKLFCDNIPEKALRPGVKEKLGGESSCVLYATPDLADHSDKYGVGSNQGSIMAVCVNPDKAMVTEDIDSPVHPMHHQNEAARNAYYLSKMVSLREYREKRLNYTLPEVLISGITRNDRIIGGVDLISGTRYPTTCACESEKAPPLLDELLEHAGIP